MYIFLKLCEILGNTQYHYLFKSCNIRSSQDDKWQEICLKLDLKFIPSIISKYILTEYIESHV